MSFRQPHPNQSFPDLLLFLRVPSHHFYPHFSHHQSFLQSFIPRLKRMHLFFTSRPTIATGYTVPPDCLHGLLGCLSTFKPVGFGWFLRILLLASRQLLSARIFFLMFPILIFRMLQCSEWPNKK